MSDALVGALVGGALTLLGGLAGGMGLDAWRTKRAGKIAARLLFLESLGNMRRYMEWRNRVIATFDPLMSVPGTAQALMAQWAIVNGMREGDDAPPDSFFPAAARVVEQATGSGVEPPLFKVTMWEMHGAAFTAAAPAETLGLVHGAYYALIHDAPTYAALRPGLDAVGAMAYASPPGDPVALALGRRAEPRPGSPPELTAGSS